MLQNAGGIGRAEFSLFLSSSICSNQSLLTLGGRSGSVRAGDYHVVDSLDPSFWSVEMERMQFVNNEKETYFIPSIRLILIDSGTSKVTIPSADLKDLILKWRSEYGLDC